MQKAEKMNDYLMNFSQQNRELSSTFNNLGIDVQAKEILHEHSHNREDGLAYVHNIFLTKDGKYLATGNRDKIPKLWNLQTGICFRTFEGHTRRAGDVSVSADNKYLASCSWDGTARVWDIQKVKCIKIFKGHRGGLRGCYLSADAKYLVTVGFDHTAKLWHTSSGRCVRTFEGHRNWIRRCYISNGGKYIATASGDGIARIWHALTGRCIRKFDVYCREVQPNDDYDGVLSVHLDEKNKILATASGNGKIHIWDVATGRCMRTLKGHSKYEVWSVFLSTDGKYLVSSSTDKSAKLWDMTTGECIRRYEGHKNTVEATFLSADSHLLVTGGHDNTVRFWKTFSGEQLAGFYDLKDGFLWFTPPDKAAKSGWFWTDRPESIRVMKCNADGSEKDLLADNDPQRIAYINTYNRQDMVMNRLNDYKQYKHDLEGMLYRFKTNNLLNQSGQLSTLLIAD